MADSSSGVAILSVGTLAANSPNNPHSLTATYSGDNVKFAASTSLPIMQNVTSLNFTISLMDSASPGVANIGKPLTVTSQVTNNSGGTVDNVSYAATFTGHFVVNSIQSTLGNSCSATALITTTKLGCTLGAMNNAQSATVTMTITPVFPTYTIIGTATVNAGTSQGTDVIKVRPLPFRR